MHAQQPFTKQNMGTNKDNPSLEFRWKQGKPSRRWKPESTH